MVLILLRLLRSDPRRSGHHQAETAWKETIEKKWEDSFVPLELKKLGVRNSRVQRTERNHSGPQTLMLGLTPLAQNPSTTPTVSIVLLKSYESLNK